MTSWRDQVSDSLNDFEAVAKLAGELVPFDDILVEFHDAAHKPPTLLPVGKMAIYGFWWNGCWLKIGKVGPQS